MSQAQSNIRESEKNLGKNSTIKETLHSVPGAGSVKTKSDQNFLEGNDDSVPGAGSVKTKSDQNSLEGNGDSVLGAGSVKTKSDQNSLEGNGDSVPGAGSVKTKSDQNSLEGNDDSVPGAGSVKTKSDQNSLEGNGDSVLGAGSVKSKSDQNSLEGNGDSVLGAGLVKTKSDQNSLEGNGDSVLGAESVKTKSDQNSLEGNGDSVLGAESVKTKSDQNSAEGNGDSVPGAGLVKTKSDQNSPKGNSDSVPGAGSVKTKSDQNSPKGNSDSVPGAGSVKTKYDQNSPKGNIEFGVNESCGSSGGQHLEERSEGEKPQETGEISGTDGPKQKENPETADKKISTAQDSEKDSEGGKLLETGDSSSPKQQDPGTGGADETSSYSRFLDRNVTFRSLIMAYTITTVISFLLGVFCLHTSNFYLGKYGSGFSGNFSKENDSNLQICLATQKEMTGKLNGMEITIDNRITENKKKLEEVLLENKMLQEKFRNLNHNQNLMKGDQEFKSAKQVNSETFWLTVFVLGAVELLIFIFVTRITKVRGPTERPWPSTSQTRVIFPSEIQGLDHNTPRNLQNSVCVLSFYGGTPHNNHLTVSRSFLDQTVKVEDFVIDRHEDILKVPNSKVVLVHVDYNARNIILEDPNREIGDLKRKTVLSLQKMGVAVIVFYYEEKTGRGSMDNGKLYNPQLESVKIHSVLKQLEAQQRVISLREGATLTEHQKRHLKSAVSNVLRSR